MSFASPLIIGGFQRSGTTFLSKLLNYSDEVFINGEIHLKILNNLFSFQKDIIKLYSYKKEYQEKFINNYLNFIYDNFYYLSKKNEKLDYKNKKYIGFKTPLVEKIIYDINSSFKFFGHELTFVYCIRHPFEVWHSLKQMPWRMNPNLDDFIEKYKSSYQCYVNFKNNNKTVLFNLNLFRDTNNKIEFVKTKIFDNLNIFLPNDITMNVLEKKINSFSEVTKIQQLKEMNLSDNEIILKDVDIQNIIKEQFN